MRELSRKEALLNELKRIEEEENTKLIEENYPKIKEMEGKCFRYRNCFSMPEKPEDYWFKYIKIQKINKDDLYVSGGKVLSEFTGFSFETDKNGVITINTNCTEYVHFIGSGHYEISEEEFQNAWTNLKQKSLNIDV